ncbi:unnamed protein product [Gulo gulo]|uniref:Uncharacterized protein n=1 Tax=Gulo gulo TaxID=48420 RepID=A0A9X9PYE9_GULGU|nr:unnamed protein product [Gulo gulo]
MEPPGDGKKQKNIKHGRNVTFMRLSTLPKRCSTNLQPENSLEPLKRSWGLPNLCAAMLMATTLMTS